MLPPHARKARAERLQQLRALIDAGLYTVDAGRLANAILRAGNRTAPIVRPPARSLDMRVSA
jgi:anti-sigma28 factor (negative regulator of flagellin synthesis)